MAVPRTWFLTATATDAAGDTSEFSQGLTLQPAADLGLDTAPKARKAAAPAKPGRKAAAKKPPAVVAYRDEAGNSWVGRGKRPQWLRDALAAGRKLEDFKVKPEA